VIDGLTVFILESAGSVGHHSFALHCPDGWTEIRLLTHAIYASFLVALRRIAGNDDISYFDPMDSLTYTLDDTGSLMSENTGPVGASSTASVKFIDIGVAEGIGEHFDPDLSFFGRVHCDGLYFQAFFGSVGDGRFALDRLWSLHVRYVLL
jgi:hypothetical protein